MASLGDILNQPQGGEANAGNGKTYTIVKKGSYSALSTLADGLSPKAKHTIDQDEHFVQSWDLQRVNSGLGVLTIQCGGNGGGGGGDDDDDELGEEWSLRHTQMILPLSRFAGAATWSQTAPNGISIEQWRREPCKALRDQFKFTAPDGNVYVLSTTGTPSEQAIAQKYLKGIDSAMRFYPVVVKKTRYRASMDDDAVNALGLGAGLSHINTPDRTFGISGLTWLKIQDDFDLAADGTKVRTEGWQGCHTLDPNLYGETGSGNTRWEPIW